MVTALIIVRVRDKDKKIIDSLIDFMEEKLGFKKGEGIPGSAYSFWTVNDILTPFFDFMLTAAIDGDVKQVIIPEGKKFNDIIREALMSDNKELRKRVAMYLYLGHHALKAWRMSVKELIEEVSKDIGDEE